MILINIVIWNFLIERWNSLLAILELGSIRRYTSRNGHVIELNGVSLLILDRVATFDSYGATRVFESIFNLIETTDSVRYRWVSRYISRICISTWFEKDFSYNVYTKTLCINFPFEGYAEDPKWLIEGVASYIVERAAFGKIYFSCKVTRHPEYFARISNLLFLQRKLFCLEIGGSWDKYYQNKDLSREGYTPLFDG